MQTNSPRGRRPFFADAFEYSLVGIEMGAAVGIGIYLGYRLDRWLVWTQPWMTMLFMGLGLVAAGRALYRAIREMQAKLKREEGEPRSE